MATAFHRGLHCPYGHVPLGIHHHLGIHRPLGPHQHRAKREMVSTCFVVGCNQWVMGANNLRKHLSEHSLGRALPPLDLDQLQRKRYVVCPHCKHVFLASGIAIHNNACDAAHENAEREFLNGIPDNFDSLPELHEILSCKQRSVRNLPTKCRAAFGRCRKNVLLQSMKRMILIHGNTC